MGIGRRGGLRDALLEETHQVVDRVVPTVSLVVDESLQHGERVWLRSAALVLDDAGEWRSVGEVRHLGEITRQVHRRTARRTARRQAAEELEEECIADAHRAAVGSLRTDGPERQLAGVSRAQLAEGARRGTAYPAVLAGELSARADGIDHHAAEILIRRRVREHTGGGMLAHARERRGQ